MWCDSRDRIRRLTRRQASPPKRHRALRATAAAAAHERRGVHVCAQARDGLHLAVAGARRSVELRSAVGFWCSDLVTSSGRPYHVTRAPCLFSCTSSNSTAPKTANDMSHTRHTTLCGVVQVGGSNVFERLAPTPKQLTSAKSAREEKREARELDGATFKPQRLAAAASDASRRMKSDPPPGLAQHVARMVPVTATMRNDSATGGSLGATTEQRALAECTFAPKVRVCLRSSWRRDVPHEGSYEASHRRSHQQSYPRIASKDRIQGSRH